MILTSFPLAKSTDKKGEDKIKFYKFIHYLVIEYLKMIKYDLIIIKRMTKMNLLSHLNKCCN